MLAEFGEAQMHERACPCKTSNPISAAMRFYPNSTTEKLEVWLFLAKTCFIPNLHIAVLKKT